ncbi:MAG TPA: haloacid dehalogenase type II, partial [Burkholderiales bacterium]
LVFDAYGTLFDVHSVVELCERFYPGKGEQFSRAWRGKQLEYTWLRSLMGDYQDFEHVTEAALHHACRSLGLPCDQALRDRLMNAYLNLSPFPEVRGALGRLSGLPLAILSNGSPGMLGPLVKNTGLETAFAHVISVDEAKIYKPSPRVYELAPKRLGVPKEAIGFVSSNYWDAAGARSYGFQVFWINRAGVVPDELGPTPSAVLNSLAELAALVGR